jgi:phycocyanobilin lyase subunit beta
MSHSIPALIQAVEAADSAIRLADAVQNLAETKHIDALPILIAALNYNNPGAAVAAVDGLIHLGEAAVPVLLDQLEHHNYTARAWAIRALAGIGDPRGLVTLLGAATADYALSVRRGATRGLGTMKWHWFPENLREIAQEEALEALLFVAEQDEEWVVRYAGVVALQSLATVIGLTHADWLAQIHHHFERIVAQDDSAAVQARVWLAQQQLQATIQTPLPTAPSSPPPVTIDWQGILDKLYERKGKERVVLAEGDPRRYQELAVALQAGH